MGYVIIAKKDIKGYNTKIKDGYFVYPSFQEADPDLNIPIEYNYRLQYVLDVKDEDLTYFFRVLVFYRILFSGLINMLTKQEKLDYYKTFELYENNRIIEDEWKEFCNKYFNTALEDNKDFFIRLKNRT